MSKSLYIDKSHSEGKEGGPQYQPYYYKGNIVSPRIPVRMGHDHRFIILYLGKIICPLLNNVFLIVRIVNYLAFVQHMHQTALCGGLNRYIRSRCIRNYGYGLSPFYLCPIWLQPFL